MQAAIALCIQQSQHHDDLAASATTGDEQRAHRATARALDKAGSEMLKGNHPRYAGGGIYYVESRSQGGLVYRIDLRTQSCNCQNGRTCWHLAACNVIDEIRNMPVDHVLPAARMGQGDEIEIESELDAMLVAASL